MSEGERRLVIVRHGSSVWNQCGRFTGWTDILLDEQGLARDAAAGRKLAELGLEFDEVHISVLRRTRQSADSLLGAAGQPGLPRYSTWRLNERHYGQLQGMNRQEIFARWGEQKFRRWWRGYFEAPPPLDPDDPRHPRFDPLYAQLDPALLPCSESLADCQHRLLPYWREVLAPRIAAHRSLLVISHGNAIRGLVMALEKISPDGIQKVEIPPSTPLVYRFDDELEAVGRDWLV